MHKITNNKEVMNGKNRLNSNSGITLIALVITIIVLLILAGVTLSLTLGENGLIKRAQGAEGEHTKSSIQEELEMDITDMLIQKKGEELTKQEIADELGNKVIIENVTEDTIEGEYKDYEITIDKDNNVIVGDKLVGEAPKVEIKVLDTQEGIEKTSIQVIASIVDGEIESIEPMNGAILKTENSNADKIYEVKRNGEYRFKVTASNKRKVIASVRISNLLVKYNALLDIIADINENGIKEVKAMGKTNSTASLETVEHSLNVLYYKGNLVLDGTTPVTINGTTTITPNNKTYEFGNINDVATSDTMAQNTVVLKIEGNLTINEGVKVTAIASPEGHGGPKGMVIYCTGELINNGEISMTARGAKAEGENVYLWENANGSYEYVSKTGASGGGSRSNAGGSDVAAVGYSGASGTLRSSGRWWIWRGKVWRLCDWWCIIVARWFRYILFRWYRFRWF